MFVADMAGAVPECAPRRALPPMSTVGARSRTSDMPTTTLDHVDAIELTELLQFLREWLDADHDPLNASLQTFVGSSAYGSDQLRADLDRFGFLLGGNDGEPLFNPEPR